VEYSEWTGQGREGELMLLLLVTVQLNWTEWLQTVQWEHSVSQWVTDSAAAADSLSAAAALSGAPCVCVCVCSGRARVEGVARSCLRHWSLHHHRHIAGFTLAHHTPARCSLWWCLALCRPKQTSSFCQQGQRTSSSLGVSSSI